MLSQDPTMPKPFKLSSTRPLPPAAEILVRDGKPHVRLKERGRTLLLPLTKDGRGYLRPSKSWYFKCRDASGTVRRVKGCSDLKATEQLAAEAERNASRVRSGYTDPAEAHARRPLADHLKDYAAALEAKDDTTDHIAKTTGRIGAICRGAGFEFLKDVDAGKATEWLNALRRDAAPVSLPSGDAFTPASTAKLLGISKSAVSAAIRRLNLTAAGNGKARTFPRATVEALAFYRAQGCGPETVNHYVRAIRGFFRWLVKVNRVGSNPLASLSLLNSAVDVRHARRELTAEELGTLLVATRSSKSTFRGLTATDRYFLYLTAASTGFRANALANLTPADFDLNSGSPTVTLAARFNKSRKTKVQPLPADVADALRAYLACKAGNVLVWGGTWSSGCTAAEMLRRDLAAAGIAYSVKSSDGPEYADFHALRHTYLTMLGRNGVDLRTAQELAGHSTPELTARYTHRRLHDLAGAVGKLPNLVPAVPIFEEMRHRTTMPEGNSGVPPGVPMGGAGEHRPAPMCTHPDSEPADDYTLGTPEMQGFGISLHRPASHSTSGASRIRTENQGIMSPLL